MRNRALRVCGVSCGLLVLAFVVGSCNLHNLNNEKRDTKTVSSKLALGVKRGFGSGPVSMVTFCPAHTRSATNKIINKCTALVKNRGRQEEKPEYRTLSIPKEHLMVRSGYQQLGRLALIYAHCIQYMNMVRTGTPVNYPVERKRLVMMNQKLINQCVIHYTKLQARLRSIA